MKRFIFIIAIAVIVAQVLAIVVMGQGFSLKALALSIPLAIAGYLIGWLIRFVAVNIMGGTVTDWRDALFSIILPFLGAVIAALIGPGLFL